MHPVHSRQLSQRVDARPLRGVVDRFANAQEPSRRHDPSPRRIPIVGSESVDDELLYRFGSGALENRDAQAEEDSRYGTHRSPPPIA
jgi:hypothetical protein